MTTYLSFARRQATPAEAAEAVVNEKIGNFAIEDLEVTGGQIRYSLIGLYLRFPNTCATTYWDGTPITTDDVFESIVNAYLRGDSNYTFYGPLWDQNFSQFKTGEHTLRVVKGSEFLVYRMGLKTKFFSFYYSDDGQVLLLDAQNGLVTEQECFFMTALVEELTAIANKEFGYDFISQETWQYAENELELSLS